MIKNIQDRRTLSSSEPRLPYRWGRRCIALVVLLSPVSTVHSKPEITIQSLAPQSIAQLHEFSKNNPGAFTIHLIPEKKWLETITDFVTAPFTALCNAFSLKNVSLTLISGALSLGWISYLLCAYLIYKTYHVIKNVNSWVNWCSDDDLLSDYDALYRKFDLHKRTRISTKKPSLRLMTLRQEKELLASYLRLDLFLRTHNLRHHFPHADTQTHKQINHAYAKLQKAEELLTVRKQRVHFARNL